MRMNNKNKDDDDLDKLDWDLEAGDDMDFEDEFGYEGEEEPQDTDDNYFRSGKYNGKK
jgi:hypothetical protein